MLDYINGYTANCWVPTPHFAVLGLFFWSVAVDMHFLWKPPKNQVGESRSKKKKIYTGESFSLMTFLLTPRASSAARVSLSRIHCLFSRLDTFYYFVPCILDTEKFVNVIRLLLSRGISFYSSNLLYIIVMSDGIDIYDF